MTEETGDNTRIAYIIANIEGDYLTDVSNPSDLQWTALPLIEDEGRRAITFRNPYQIPLRVAQNLSSEHLVYRVHIQDSEKKAGLTDILAAELVGVYQTADHFDMKPRDSRDHWRYADRIR